MLGKRRAMQLVALLSCLIFAEAAHQNVTTLLSGHPNYSTFNSLLVKSGVAAQINSRVTITVLCPPNAAMDAFMSARGNAMDRQTLFNVLSYHVLLDYMDQTKLHAMKPGNGIITTLFQTTGLATGQNGAVDLTGPGAGSPAGSIGRIRMPGSNTLAANITSSIELFPYNISILAIDAVLLPEGSSLPVNGPINITETISYSGNFSHFVTLLTLTGVDQVFQSHQNPPGITILVPTNAAIESMHQTLAALPNSDVATLLQYHALPAFYPAQELIAAATPQPTIASADNSPTSFTLYTTGREHSVTVHAGRNTANVLGSHYSINPVSIFSIDAVLQPAEIFTSTHAPRAIAGPPASSPSSPAPSTAAPASSLAPSSSPSTSPSPSVASPSPLTHAHSPAPVPAATSPSAEFARSSPPWIVDGGPAASPDGGASSAAGRFKSSLSVGLAALVAAISALVLSS